jgi:hypothetical protein
LRSPVLNQYHLALVKQNVIEIIQKEKNEKKKENKKENKKEGKFHKDFKKKTSDELHKLLFQDFKIEKDATFELSEAFGKENSNSEALPQSLPDETRQFTKEEIDKIIDEFFDSLILAVNQPNVNELDEVIKNELGEEFNLIDSDCVAGNIQDFMLKWFTKKEGEFLTCDDGKQLINETRKKLKTIILISSKLEYCAKMEDFGIKFVKNSIDQGINIFLDSTDQQILIVKTEYKNLSAIKIYQVLESREQYKKDNSYIFKSFDSLLLIQKDVLGAFEQEPCSLLIIESTGKKPIKHDDHLSLFQILFDIIRKDKCKKIVFIANNNDTGEILKLTGNKALVLDNLNDDHFDLARDSQKNLIKRAKISLQGKEVSLNEMGIDNYRKLMNVLDPETLEKIINDDTIRVGNELRSSGTIQECIVDFYEPQSFYQTIYSIQLDESTFEEILKKQNALFALSNVSNEEIQQLIQDKDKVILFSECANNFGKMIFIILNDDKANEQFELMKQSHRNRVIIWPFSVE